LIKPIKMKKGLFTLFSLLMVLSFTKAQTANLSGSWTAETNGVNHLLLISGSYFSHTMYGKEDGAFIMTMGGQYSINDYGQTRATIEFNSQDPSMVGMTHYVEMKRDGEKLRISGTEGMVPAEWKSADLTTETTPLTGPWLMAGRKKSKWRNQPSRYGCSSENYETINWNQIPMDRFQYLNRRIFRIRRRILRS
jgi:hypothetical protein